MPPMLPERVDVAIVGAGFGGLGLAIQMRRHGLEDFVVLEREGDVGGTWNVNTYPGAQCDIPSNLYSWSFALKPDWSRAYPERDEIHDYIRSCVDHFDAGRFIHLNTEMLDAEWTGDAWRVETSGGELEARVLVAAPGLLSEPTIPDLPGLEDFQGPYFHTANWNHDHDLTGRDVAVVGTGATAIQVVPRIKDQVRKLTVFQRTPPWVILSLDREVSKLAHWLYPRVPGVQRMTRTAMWASLEPIALGMTRWPALLKGHEMVSRAMIRLQVKDPDLRERLIPTYAFGCKRMLLSNQWYPALDSPNVELVTQGVEEVREHALVAADGSEHPADTIVFATGFTPTDPPIARRLRGREGRTLSEVWGGSPQSYLASTVAGFPNLFLLYGPNSNLGHNSIVYMLESQMNYVMGALKAMRERGHHALEVRPEVQDAFNEEMQSRLARSVWDAGGCGSWYLDANGRDSTMWPGFTYEFRKRTRAFDLDSYVEPPVVSSTAEATLAGSSNIGM
jgi:cation diffusion facilitator CzcD-associated flavoprotein CzcO